MKRLIELAEKIKDKNLREKTIKLLEEPEISNSEIMYPKADLKKIPAWVVGHHFYDGGLIDHTFSVTNASILMAKNFEEIYKTSINYDHLIAGALLHDIMKVFVLCKTGKQWNFTGCTLDHAVLTACELYAREFPEEVIHIVASHGGDLGSAGANPRTLEALIVFYSDMMDSTIESFVHGSMAQNLQFLLTEKDEK